MVSNFAHYKNDLMILQAVEGSDIYRNWTFNLPASGATDLWYRALILSASVGLTVWSRDNGGTRAVVGVWECLDLFLPFLDLQVDSL